MRFSFFISNLIAFDKSKFLEMRRVEVNGESKFKIETIIWKMK